MKLPTIRVLTFFLLAGIIFAGAAQAGASDNLLLENGQLFLANSQGGKRELPDMYLLRHALAGESMVYSLSFAPDSEFLAAAQEAVRPGSYFWREDGKLIGYLPESGEAGLSHDSGQDRLTLFIQNEGGSELALYEFPALTEIGRLKNASGLHWLADGRVAYTWTDREQSRPDSYRSGWSSVAVSRPDGSGRVIAAQAGKTEDYILVRLDRKDGQDFLFIQKDSVNHEKDWANEDPNSEKNPVKTEFLTINASIK